jgi:hypothetical protein
MEIQELLKNDFRYKRLVSQVGADVTDNEIVPGILRLLDLLNTNVQKNFKVQRNYIRRCRPSAAVFYIPSNSDLLHKQLEIRDSYVLKQVREVLENPKAVKIWIDRLVMEADFSGESYALIRHPYLSRLTERHMVVLHASRNSIRIELR